MGGMDDGQTRQTRPPRTDEGWYVLHEFYRVDWERWQELPEDRRERFLTEGTAFFEDAEAVADAPTGDSAVAAMLGHHADLLVIHLRPTLDHLSTLERRFEQTALARVTERVNSYVAVTEVSDYVSEAYFETDEAEQSEGIQRYLDAKLRPTLPENEYVCFYPMDRRRETEANWYTEDFEERSAMMTSHGRIGREYAGEITQVVTNAIGFDTHEFGVTLFADDPTAIKDIVYEMRFDEVSARYSDFPYFRIGRRFPPTDLSAFFAGEPVPTTEQNDDDEHKLREDLREAGIYAGEAPTDDRHAVMHYSTADPATLFEAVEELRSDFDRYDTHDSTRVYVNEDGDRHVVASLWDTADAADTAAGFLTDLPAVTGRPDDREGFGTMGLFYRVKPDKLEVFHSAFTEVKAALEDVEGHRGAALLENYEDETDLFIDSRWENQEAASTFFQSDQFKQAVSSGRELLAEQPRHVFFE